MPKTNFGTSFRYLLYKIHLMEHQYYLKTLKVFLKRNGINYQALAKELKMTESGIKKMLNGKDISFRRLIEICKVLNITPSQLMKDAEEKTIHEVHFNEVQTAALANDKVLLQIFWLVAVENKSNDKIPEILNINKSILQNKLAQLTRLELIKESRGKHMAMHKGPLRWPDSSKVSQILNKNWSIAVLKKALMMNKMGGPYHRLSYLKLSAKSYAELSASIHQLLDSFARRSEIESLNSEVIDTSVLIAHIPSGPLSSSLEMEFQLPTK